jgi:ethanolamine utilization protein EutN
VFIARVVGDVVSSHRHANLGGRKLLLVRRLDLDGNEEGDEVIALDVIGVGDGERVLVVQEGGSARAVFDDPKIPVQAVVVGVIDELELQQDSASRPPSAPDRPRKSTSR